MADKVLASVLVADDDPLVRSHIRQILSAEASVLVVGEAEDGAEAVAKASSLDPDVVLMDVRMPGMDGVEATRRLTLHNPARPKVLSVSAMKDYRLVYKALEAGAFSFILKRDFDLIALVNALRAAVSGDTPENRGQIRTVVERANADGKRSQKWASRVNALTPRRREVLGYIGLGLDNWEIATKLYLTEHTIGSHVQGVYTTLGVHGRAQAVIAAYESGLIVPGGGCLWSDGYAEQ